LRATRKLLQTEISDSDIHLAKTPRAPSSDKIFFLKTLRLCAFARDIPRFGCGFATLGSLRLKTPIPNLLLCDLCALCG
jgi:hypothetical protein